MALIVEVKCAANLPILKAHALSTLAGRNWDDPFCKLTFHGQKQSTTPKLNDPKPEWMEVFEWTLEVVPDTTEVVEVVVYDFEKSADHREMCTGKIPLTTVLAKGSDDLVITLEHVQGKPREDNEGKTLDATLHVSLTYKPPVSAKLDAELASLRELMREAIGEIQVALDKMKQGVEEVPRAKRRKL